MFHYLLKIEKLPKMASWESAVSLTLKIRKTIYWGLHSTLTLFHLIFISILYQFCNFSNFISILYQFCNFSSFFPSSFLSIFLLLVFTFSFTYAVSSELELFKIVYFTLETISYILQIMKHTRIINLVEVLSILTFTLHNF